MRGIARMVEDDTYCIDVLTQLSAATKALHSVGIGLLEEHIGALRRRRRAASPTRPPPPRSREATDAIARLVRS